MTDLAMFVDRPFFLLRTHVEGGISNSCLDGTISSRCRGVCAIVLLISHSQLTQHTVALQHRKMSSIYLLYSPASIVASVLSLPSVPICTHPANAMVIRNSAIRILTASSTPCCPLYCSNYQSLLTSFYLNYNLQQGPISALVP